MSRPVTVSARMPWIIRTARQISSGWDIGMAVRFLLSAQARYITGHTLVVDGGATLVGPQRDPN